MRFDWLLRISPVEELREMDPQPVSRPFFLSLWSAAHFTPLVIGGNTGGLHLEYG